TGALPGQAGRFIVRCDYSGPSAYLVHVETNAQNGRNAYVDADSPFQALPAGLRGADWVQVADRDALYHAVDLMELAVAAGTRVTIAHDDRLPRPPWLLDQFAASGAALEIAGVRFSLFQRDFATPTGLTFGPNTEDTSAREGAMYLVFAGPAAR
ncbi:MAG: hypothetical protein NDI75_16355, partial [Candidatus Didemnitutus sp.]|nr:hypothetical protein [Candidatus Didemnitutus sp.]